MNKVTAVKWDWNVNYIIQCYVDRGAGDIVIGEYLPHSCNPTIRGWWYLASKGIFVIPYDSDFSFVTMNLWTYLMKHQEATFDCIIKNSVRWMIGWIMGFIIGFVVILATILNILLI